jgi:hypothetical protein
MKLRRWLIPCLFIVGIGLLVRLALILLTANRHSPQAILAELELLTPLGSTVAEVELAIRERGLEGMCWQEEKDGRKSKIMIRFAEFVRPSVPPLRIIIESHWHFGPDGKLNDISLDYYDAGIFLPGIGALFMTKENEKPISLSNRRQ